jgi:hypothetical protein
MRGMPMPFGLKWPTQPEMAPAGLWTTPTDLAEVAIEVGKALAGKSSLLPREWASAMVHPGLGDWGLGWQIYRDGGFDRFGHGGEVPGYVASVEMSMDGNSGFVIMANRDTARGLLIEASNALARELGWPIGPTERTATNLGIEQLRSIVGRYSFGPEHVADIVLRGQDLFWNLDMEEWRLYPQSRDDFFTLQPGAPTFHFVRSADGSPTSVVARLAGMQFTGERVR